MSEPTTLVDSLGFLKDLITTMEASNTMYVLHNHRIERFLLFSSASDTLADVACGYVDCRDTFLEWSSGVFAGLGARSVALFDSDPTLAPAARSLLECLLDWVSSSYSSSSSSDPLLKLKQHPVWLPPPATFSLDSCTHVQYFDSASLLEFSFGKRLRPLPVKYSIVIQGYGILWISIYPLLLESMLPTPEI